MLKKVVILLLLSGMASAQTTGPRYASGKHKKSHGGHYQNGHGKHHKGGHYKNPKTGDRYGKHK